MELREENIPYAHVATMTVLFFVATSTTACAVSDLGIVFQFIGGIAGSLLIFILPGALIIADHQHMAQPVPLEPEARASTSATGAAADADVSMLWGDAPESLSREWRSRQAHQRGGAARRGDPRPSTCYGRYGALDEKACYESAWDTLAVGWALVVVGVCVILLTLMTAAAPLLHGAAGAGMHDSFADSGAASPGRSLQALSVALAA